MTSPTVAAMHALLAQSLTAWRLAGDARREPDGSIVIVSGDARIRVAPAGSRQPFRWMVTVGARTRGAGSVAGVLRAVRTALDVNYAPDRLRIAPVPVLP